MRWIGWHNHAHYCTTYGGNRSFRTDGKKYKNPVDEADDAVERLQRFAALSFDEFLTLRFEAINELSYAFSWSDEEAMKMDYGAALVRISQQYTIRI